MAVSSSQLFYGVLFPNVKTIYSYSSKVQNVTLPDLATQMYYLEYEPQSTGTQVIQININGQPASMSPVIFEVEEAPLRVTRCAIGCEANDEGQCNQCPAGTASPGGTASCRACDPGTKQPLEGQGSCESCPVARCS